MSSKIDSTVAEIDRRIGCSWKLLRGMKLDDGCEELEEASNSDERSD